MKEDFIQTQHQNPPLTAMIEEGQQGPGLAARLGHPAPYRGPTRSSPVRQKNGQQRDNLAQAQTHRGTRGGKRLLRGLWQRLRTSPGFP